MLNVLILPITMTKIVLDSDLHNTTLSISSV